MALEDRSKSGGRSSNHRADQVTNGLLQRGLASRWRVGEAGWGGLKRGVVLPILRTEMGRILPLGYRDEPWHARACAASLPSPYNCTLDEITDMATTF